MLKGNQGKPKLDTETPDNQSWNYLSIKINNNVTVVLNYNPNNKIFMTNI